MRILIPGGSGQVGRVLARHLTEAGHQVTVLSRNPRPAPWQTLQWDGITEGPWVSELHRADAVIGLSGRIVNTRYTPKHRREILDSRILPTQLLGKLITASPTPPRIWLNASTATIYRHSLDREVEAVPRRVLDRQAGDAGLRAPRHVGGDLRRRVPERVLEVGVDRQRRRLDDRRDVGQRELERHAVVGPGRRPGHPRARRGDGLEPELLQPPRRAGGPRVRDGEAARLVQLAEPVPDVHPKILAHATMLLPPCPL